MDPQLAVVLGGGGARGALQVGALRALLEAGYQPGVLTGTSIGAMNAVTLALGGLDRAGIDCLEGYWREAAAAGLMPAGHPWLLLRMLFHGGEGCSYRRMREFLIAHGVTPALRFRDLSVRVVVVAADLDTGRPVLFGLDQDDGVLEGVLASTALPPWIQPQERDGHLLLDGGVVSNLPIEAALQAGATRIIALDLADTREIPHEAHDVGSMMGRLVEMVTQRTADLEIATARAQHVDLRCIVLQGVTPVAVGGLDRTEELIARGYEVAREEIDRWQLASVSS